MVTLARVLLFRRQTHRVQLEPGNRKTGQRVSSRREGGEGGNVGRVKLGPEDEEDSDEVI